MSRAPREFSLLHEAEGLLLATMKYKQHLSVISPSVPVSRTPGEHHVHTHAHMHTPYISHAAVLHPTASCLCIRCRSSLLLLICSLYFRRTLNLKAPLIRLPRLSVKVHPGHLEAQVV